MGATAGAGRLVAPAVAVAAAAVAGRPPVVETVDGRGVEDAVVAGRGVEEAVVAGRGAAMVDPARGAAVGAELPEAVVPAALVLQAAKRKCGASARQTLMHVRARFQSVPRGAGLVDRLAGSRRSWAQEGSADGTRDSGCSGLIGRRVRTSRGE